MRSNSFTIFFWTCLICFLGFFAVVEVNAAPGKIRGQLVDSQSGDPLPGANVIVEGTMLGSTTDVDGYYNVINVPPGTYTVVASIIGYTTVKKTDVVVIVGRTVTVNFSLSTEVIGGEEVTITAKREVVPLDITMSRVDVNVAEVVETAPIIDLTQLLSLQAGIEPGAIAQGTSERQEDQLVIRGGGDDQIALMFDGVTLVNERQNQPYLNIPLSGIESVEVITGGFNPEYGNIRSGLLQLTSKKGRDQYGFSADFRVSPPSYKHFGDDLYWTQDWRIWAGPNSMDSTAEFIGWRRIADQLNNDNDPTNDITPEGAQRRWEWLHRPLEYGEEGPADYLGEFTFGGPVPVVNNWKFFFSGKRQFESSIVPLYAVTSKRIEGNTAQAYTLRLTSQLASNVDLQLSGLYGDIEWLSNPNGSTQQGREFMDREFLPLSATHSSQLRFKYMYAANPAEQKTYMLSGKLTHSLSPKTFYTVQAEWLRTNDDKYWIERDETPQFEYEPGKFLTEEPWGRADVFASTDLPGVYTFRGDPNILDSSSTRTIRVRGDISSQVNSSNFLKAGFEFNFTNLKENFRWFKPSLNNVDVRMQYDRKPMRLSGYVQDKLEWEGMIANFGLRLDYVDSRANFFTDPFSPYYTSALIDSIDSAPQEPAEERLRLAPRFGVSHPIGERTKLFFNYGHFYSMPLNTQYYSLQTGTQGGRQLTLLGNPNLEIPKTVAYELGFDQDLVGQVLLHVVGYYKDVTDQAAQVRYSGRFGEIGYNGYTSQQYQDIFGLEFRLEKKYGKYFYGWANYNWVKTTTGFIGETNIFEDPRIETQRAGAQQLRPATAPNFRMGLDFHTPMGWGPNVLGGKFLGGWALNFLYVWRAGDKFTFAPTNPEDTNNVQWVNFSNTDMRLTKRFGSLFGIGLQPELYFIVENLFNQKFLNRGAFDTDEWGEYLFSLKFPHYEGELKGDDRVGIYPENGKNEHVILPKITNQWALFRFPRNYFFGARIFF